MWTVTDAHLGEASPLPGKIIGRVGASKMASGKFSYLYLACCFWSYNACYACKEKTQKLQNPSSATMLSLASSLLSSKLRSLSHMTSMQHKLIKVRLSRRSSLLSIFQKKRCHFRFWAISAETTIFIVLPGLHCFGPEKMFGQNRSCARKCAFFHPSRHK